MKTFKVHFEQENATWIEVEASNKRAAINKAIREMRTHVRLPDCIDDGKEETEIEQP